MSISDGFIETNCCSVVLARLSCVWQEVWTLKLGGDLLFWKTKKCAHKRQHTDGVGIRFFYLLWWLDLKPTARSLCNSHLLGFFNQVAAKRKRKVSTINAQPLSKDAEQNSIKTSCLGCRRVISAAQKAISKIILHRIISAVWLTNFLSEIRSLSNHDDETQFRILSVKPIWSFSAFDHWWSLTVQLRAVMDGE